MLTRYCLSEPPQWVDVDDFTNRELFRWKPYLGEDKLSLPIWVSESEKRGRPSRKGRPKWPLWKGPVVVGSSGVRRHTSRWGAANWPPQPYQARADVLGRVDRPPSS